VVGVDGNDAHEVAREMFHEVADEMAHVVELDAHLLNKLHRLDGLAAL
jgi:hypothetical protein